MIGWLWRLIVGRFSEAPECRHEWETVRSGGSAPGVFGSSFTWYDCRCKKCGHMKCFKL
jgi:hypothetical protein